VIVLDASAVVEILTNGPFAESFQHDMGNGAGSFIAPHLLDIEVISALRRIAAAGRLNAERTELALTRFAKLPAERYPHTPLLHRVWELRHNFTAYDAIYIALAEETDSVLCTTDAKLRTGHRARVRVLAV